LLDGSGVLVGAVISFPQGNSCTESKRYETELACKDGATEIDMVINIGKALGGDWPYISAEIKAIHEAVLAHNALLKVIFENDYLQDSQIIKLCEICSAIGVAFVKTSTGYGFVKQEDGMYSYKGATVAHLKLMRRHCPPSVRIKAAGGVRTLDDLLHGVGRAVAAVEGAEARLRAAVRFHVLFHAHRQHEAFLSHSELRSLPQGNLRLVLTRRDEYERVFRGLLTSGVRAGVFQVSDVRLTAMAILTMCTGVATWFSDRGRLAPEAIADRYVEMILRSVKRCPKGSPS